MPAIEVRARSYASAAEMRASHVARRTTFFGAPKRVEFGTDLRSATPTPSIPPAVKSFPPVIPIFDDEYAEMLAVWYGRGLSPSRLVVTLVAAHFRMTRAEILGRRRNPLIVTARHVAMYICVRYLRYSFPQAGRFLGGRDHTTVLHAFRKVTARMERDPDFAAQVERLVDAVKGER